MSNDKITNKTITTKFSRTLYSAKSILGEAGIKVEPNKYYQFWPTTPSAIVQDPNWPINVPATQTCIVQDLLDLDRDHSDWIKGSELYRVGIYVGTATYDKNAVNVKVVDQMQSHDPIGTIKSYKVSYAVRRVAKSLNNHAPTIEFIKQPIAGRKYQFSDVVKTADLDGDKIQCLFLYTNQSSDTKGFPGTKVYFNGKEMSNSKGFLIFEEQRQYVTFEFLKGKDKAAILGWTKDDKGTISNDVYHPKPHIFNVKKQ